MGFNEEHYRSILNKFTAPNILQSAYEKKRNIENANTLPSELEISGHNVSVRFKELYRMVKGRDCPAAESHYNEIMEFYEEYILPDTHDPSVWNKAHYIKLKEDPVQPPKAAAKFAVKTYCLFEVNSLLVTLGINEDMFFANHNLTVKGVLDKDGGKPSEQWLEAMKKRKRASSNLDKGLLS